MTRTALVGHWAACEIGAHTWDGFNARRLSVRWVRKLHEIGFIYVFSFDCGTASSLYSYDFCFFRQPNGTNCGLSRRFTDAHSIVSSVRKWCFAWAEMQFMIKNARESVRMNAFGNQSQSHKSSGEDEHLHLPRKPSLFSTALLNEMEECGTGPINLSNSFFVDEIFRR